jgi:hypothetical protein
MMEIDRYKERVDNMLFRATFAEKHQQLSRVSWSSDEHIECSLIYCLEYECCIRSLYQCKGLRIVQGAVEGT